MVEKDWPFDAVMEEQEKIAPGQKLARRGDPVSQWCTLHGLDELEKRYAAGDKLALHAAINRCVLDGLPLPDWVARAHRSAYYKMCQYQVGSWDEAFECTNPKAVRLQQARQRLLLSLTVALRIQRILYCEPETAIDNGLFERVAEEFRIGERQAKEFWYQHRELHGRPCDGTKRQVAIRRALEPELKAAAKERQEATRFGGRGPAKLAERDKGEAREKLPRLPDSAAGRSIDFNGPDFP